MPIIGARETGQHAHSTVRAPWAWKAAPIPPFGAARLGREEEGWEQSCAPLSEAERAWSGSGFRACISFSPWPLGAQGRMGALGQSGPSVCSGLVAPETPQLGIKPEEGQILLPKHKSPHIK